MTNTEWVIALLRDAGWETIVVVIGNVVVLVAAVGYAIVTLASALSGTTLIQRAVWCPLKAVESDVVFLVQNGVPYDVTRCALCPKGKVACRKPCLTLVGASAT